MKNQKNCVMLKALVRNFAGRLEPKLLFNNHNYGGAFINIGFYIIFVLSLYSESNPGLSK